MSEIHQCILLDRETDMVTSLFTPLTYEALINEVFGIENNVIRVNPKILEKDDTERVV